MISLFVLPGESQSAKISRASPACNFGGLRNCELAVGVVEGDSIKVDWTEHLGL